MPSDGGLYNDTMSFVQKIQSDEANVSEADTLWEPDRLEVLKDDPIEKPEYQKDLDKATQGVDEKQYDFRNSTKSWSDYMYTRYHPRTINLLPGMNK